MSAINSKDLHFIYVRKEKTTLFLRMPLAVSFPEAAVNGLSMGQPGTGGIYQVVGRFHLEMRHKCTPRACPFIRKELLGIVSVRHLFPVSHVHRDCNKCLWNTTIQS